MISRSLFELCIISLLVFLTNRSSHVASWPFMFQDDQQTDEQAESISENFFDEVRQMIEQKLGVESASEIDYDLSTTEMFGHHRPAEEHIIETTIPAEEETRPKVELPRK